MAEKFETRFLLHSHPSGGEGMSPVQGDAIRRRYIKSEYLSYCRAAPHTERHWPLYKERALFEEGNNDVNYMYNVSSGESQFHHIHWMADYVTANKGQRVTYNISELTNRLFV